MPGSETFAKGVEYYIKKWRGQEETILVEAECPRFSTGEGKALLRESIRGRDLFLLSDPFNYSVTYTMYGKQVPMSPDDHFQDIKRMIQAIAGKADRITVIMPMLYEGRQHRRNYRESLDCAMSLQELVRMGVANIITFDAHDPRIQNAIPLNGFDSLEPTYQMIKALVRKFPNVTFDPSKTLLISPDDGGIGRCLAYSSILNLDVGMFYKRRNLSQVVDGTNPIESHEYIGQDLNGRDVIVVDDMISSGGSMIDTFHDLKQKGARHIYAFITFGLFCNGYDQFDQAYEQGIFDSIFLTNLNYRPQELLERPWLTDVDLTKYTAYFIDALNQNLSIGSIINPHVKIRQLLRSIGS